MNEKYAKYLLDKIKDDYNLIAKDFSRTRRWLWEELLFLNDYIRDGEKILDLGCGNGRLVQLFQDKKISYVGIDNSQGLIDAAVKKNPGVKFEVGDALNLPFCDGYFDKVFSIAVLHHIPSEYLRLRFLKEARRVLKPGGILFLSVWKFHQSKELFLIYKYNLLKMIGFSKLDFNDFLEPWGKKTERYCHFFNKKELISLAKKAGFGVEEIKVIKNKRGNRQNIFLIGSKG